jgi:hypothetical protein
MTINKAANQKEKEKGKGSRNTAEKLLPQYDIKENLLRQTQIEASLGKGKKIGTSKLIKR